MLSGTDIHRVITVVVTSLRVRSNACFGKAAASEDERSTLVKTKNEFQKNLKTNIFDLVIELMSKELNHLAAIFHVYAGGLIFMK